MGQAGSLERINNQKFAFYRYDKGLLSIDLFQKIILLIKLTFLLKSQLSDCLVFCFVFPMFAVDFVVYIIGGWLVGQT